MEESDIKYVSSLIDDIKKQLKYLLRKMAKNI